MTLARQGTIKIGLDYFVKIDPYMMIFIDEVHRDWR
jgi:hypothetical protein